MEKEKIFNLVKKQDLELKPLNYSYVALIVEGDENDADYITERTEFSFLDLKRALFIYNKLNELPEHYEDDPDIELEGIDPNGDKYNLKTYIPCGQYDHAHTISNLHLEICIEGQLYDVNEL